MPRFLSRRLSTAAAVVAVLAAALALPAPAQAVPERTSPGWRELSSQVAVRPLTPVTGRIGVAVVTNPVIAGDPVTLEVTFGRGAEVPRRAQIVGRVGTRLVVLDTASCQRCSKLTVVIPGSSVTAEQRYFQLRVGPTRWAVKVDGRTKALTLDTRLQITNSTGWIKTVKVGSGCVDPYGLLPITLLPTESTATVGWCALRESDVQGSFLVGNIITGFRPIDFYSGNPKVGYPWIEVDGKRHNFSAGESCAFSTQGQIFEAYRGTDLSGAKDMRLAWVDATSLGAC